MELSELVAYAGERYQIPEKHPWTDFPGFSVLCHPETGKWIALLMRQWDTETGRQIERCDLRCGGLQGDAGPHLSPPLRMRGESWVGIAFDERTEKDDILRLFDRAVALNAPSGYAIVLGSEWAAEKDAAARGDTPLPAVGCVSRQPPEALPERLRGLRRLFRYGEESGASRAKSFYTQAVYMRDYEDDVPWTGSFIRYFPTYQDLTTRQLRGYFTWRTQIRRGIYQPIAVSAAYIYIYELLNDVGASSPEDVLRRLRDFREGYLNAGLGDDRMRVNLNRWMSEYAVLNALPAEMARESADPLMIERDHALSVLRHPGIYSDEDVFSALRSLSTRKISDSPVITKSPERGMRLFSEIWRAASAFRRGEKSLFTLCFGRKSTRRWYPLSNAVYYQRSRPEDTEYALDDSRTYRCRNGLWQVSAYETLSFDRALFHGLLHGADAGLRRYLKTGRSLREKPEEAWALPYINAVIDADRKAAAEAARPVITIDFSGLERIRADAAGTRDSLLTEEEREEEEWDETARNASPPGAEAPPAIQVQEQLLHALLRGQDVSPLLRKNHLMPSIAADMINESLFDEIGDTVVICENNQLSLVEDYAKDLESLGF